MRFVHFEKHRRRRFFVMLLGKTPIFCNNMTPTLSKIPYLNNIFTLVLAISSLNLSVLAFRMVVTNDDTVMVNDAFKALESYSASLAIYIAFSLAAVAKLSDTIMSVKCNKHLMSVFEAFILLTALNWFVIGVRQAEHLSNDRDVQLAPDLLELFKSAGLSTVVYITAGATGSVQLGASIYDEYFADWVSGTLGNIVEVSVTTNTDVELSGVSSRT